MTERIFTRVAAVATLWGAAVAVASPPTPALDAQRDALIARLVQGEDVERSIEQYKQLLSARDAVVPTSAAARERAESARRAARRWSDAWRADADSSVAERCHLAIKPTGAVRDRWA